MTDPTTSQVLDKAADLIEQRGWVQGEGWVHLLNEVAGHPLCLEGAIMAASGLAFADACAVKTDAEIASLHGCPAYLTVKSYLDTTDPIFYWNDDGARTAEEVIATLRAASAVASTHTAGLPGSPVSA